MAYYSIPKVIKVKLLLMVLMMAGMTVGSAFGNSNDISNGYVLILLGPPGSGKGTQAVDLAEELNVPHISVGDLFRAAKANKTPLGQEAAKYMDQGLLVPDELTIAMVRERVNQPDAQKGYILDGFPRTLAQADKLGGLIGQKRLIVVNLDVPDEVLVNRLAGRGRADDTPETVKQRLVEYHSKTKPLIDYYQQKGALVTVNGNQNVEIVFNDVLDALNQTGVR
jgi:adenylate kinase